MGKPVSGLPAKCTACGFVFPAVGVIGGTAQVSIGRPSPGVSIGRLIVSCPRCGARALGLDGDYDMVDSVVSLITGPESTVELLKKAGFQIAQARSRGYSTEQILDLVQATLPEVSHLRRWADPMVILTGIQAAATVIGATYTLSFTEQTRMMLREEMTRQQTQQQQQAVPDSKPALSPSHNAQRKEPEEAATNSQKRVKKGKGKVRRNQKRRQHRPRR